MAGVSLNFSKEKITRTQLIIESPVPDMRYMKEENSKKIILHLCASKYGSDTKDYEENGYIVYRVLEENDVNSAKFENGLLTFKDMEPIEIRNIWGIFANPPCTEFSIAKTTAPQDLLKGMELVRTCLDIIWRVQTELIDNRKGTRTTTLKWWAIENPGSGMLRMFLGKPAFEYSPDEFGDDFTKKTALWGNFSIPTIPFFLRTKLFKRDVTSTITPMMYRDRKERTDVRSIASKKFTKAFYESNR